MIIVPLGVGSATPTVTRHLSTTALWREGSVYLFDCGENTQMRMLQGGLKRSQIECIFISHFDTDHYSGLIGLLSTLQLQRREKPLKLVGPKGLKKYVEWNLKFANIDTRYPIHYVEVEEDFESERVVDEKVSMWKPALSTTLLFVWDTGFRKRSTRESKCRKG